MAKYDKVIPPGQKGKVVIKVDGRSVHGNFKKGATIFSNDPKHPSLGISMKGKLLAYIDIKPSSRVYLSGAYGQPAGKEVTLVSNEEGLDLEILGMESNIDDKITYKVIPSEKPKELKVAIWKNPKLPALSTWGTLTLHTNSKGAPEQAIQVSITTLSSVKVKPSIVRFGRIKAASQDGEDKVYQKKVVVTKQKGQFKIKNVTFSNKYYRAFVETIDPGKKYSITVKFFPDDVKRIYNDRMFIHTNDPRESSLTVKLLARSF